MQRTNRDVRTLQRLDPTHEQHHRDVVGQIERRPCAAPVTGGEERMLDARRDDLDLALRVAVQSTELLLLFGTAHADRIGTVDELGLGPIAPARFRVAALGLDPGERVERRDERDVEFVLDPVGDHATQPVVGVDDVGATVGGEVCEHALGELVDDLGERLLGEVMGPGLDIDHPMVRLDPHLGREPGAVGACVGGALQPGLGQRRHHLADVHVHPAAVARTGLQQR